MCSAYLSKPLRTEEQAIIDLLRSGSHVVVPAEPTVEMLLAGGVVLAPDKNGSARDAYRAMVKAGAIPLTDRKKESD